MVMKEEEKKEKEKEKKRGKKEKKGKRRRKEVKERGITGRVNINQQIREESHTSTIRVTETEWWYTLGPT